MKKNVSKGVPNFVINEYSSKKNKYCLCIPIINEGERIVDELKKAQNHGIDKIIDIVICDGDSNDGCTEETRLKKLGVNTLLIKKDKGKQGAQLRMGMYWALQRGYEGIITIDGNNKDSIEDVPNFIQKLEEGFDFVQGSRFIKGGKAINTPLIRLLAVKLLHAPIISLTAGKRYTDTTNAYRAYSKKYLEAPGVDIFRDIFDSYELLAYLSVRADQLGMKTCEIPVTRSYPKKQKTPTKISPIKGNVSLLKVLLSNMFGRYCPNKSVPKSVKKSFIVLLAFLFIIFMRCIFYSKLSDYLLTPDSLTYQELTIKSLLSNGIDINRVPIYSIIIDVIRKLTISGNYINNVIIFQEIISFISIFYFYNIIKKLTNNNVVTLITSIIYGLSPCIFGFDKALLTESLSLSFLIIFIYYLLVFLENKSTKKWLLLSIFSFFLIMLKPVFLYVLVIITIYSLISFIYTRNKKSLIILLMCFVPILLTILYAFIFNYKYGVFTLSASSVKQQFVVAMQRGYYKEGKNDIILDTIEQGNVDYPWAMISDLESKGITIKELNEFNKQAFKANSHRLLDDYTNLAYRISNYEYLGYYELLDNYDINPDTQLYESKIIGCWTSFYSFVKVIYVYVIGIVALLIFCIKWTIYKKLPLIDTFLCAMILAPMVIAIIGTNAEYQRTSMTLLPAFFIYIAILIYYIGNKTLRLPFENEFLEKE